MQIHPFALIVMLMAAGVGGGLAGDFAKRTPPALPPGILDLRSDAALRLVNADPTCTLTVDAGGRLCAVCDVMASGADGGSLGQMRSPVACVP